jgi:hypothetical protein
LVVALELQQEVKGEVVVEVAVAALILGAQGVAVNSDKVIMVVLFPGEVSAQEEEVAPEGQVQERALEGQDWPLV